MGQVHTNQPKTDPVAPPYQFNEHDLKIILFHCLVAAAQAILMTLGAYHFGKYDGEVALVIQVASEALRRFVV